MMIISYAGSSAKIGASDHDSHIHAIHAHHRHYKVANLYYSQRNQA